MNDIFVILIGVIAADLVRDLAKGFRRSKSETTTLTIRLDASDIQEIADRTKRDIAAASPQWTEACNALTHLQYAIGEDDEHSQTALDTVSRFILKAPLPPISTGPTEEELEELFFMANDAYVAGFDEGHKWRTRPGEDSCKQMAFDYADGALAKFRKFLATGCAE